MATLATILVLNILGLAVGLSSGSGLTNLATGAGIWSAISALLAFFVGGWVTGRRRRHRQLATRSLVS